MADFYWDKAIEQTAVDLRAAGKTYGEIAAALGTTATSVKHKIRRIQQAANQDRYKHTAEKTDLFERTFKHRDGAFILETHCGFGGMTEVYNTYGEVDAFDIANDRIECVNALGLEGVSTRKCDSEVEIHNLIANRCRFDVIDIDPYGMPSRFFPHIFHLIDDGYLYVTVPMIGVAQINKITIEHYRVFWGVETSDQDTYTSKVFSRMKDYAFMCKREIELLDCIKIDRIYRFALRVKRASMLDLVGLTVNRKGKQVNDQQAALAL